MTGEQAHRAWVDDTRQACAEACAQDVLLALEVATIIAGESGCPLSELHALTARVACVRWLGRES